MTNTHFSLGVSVDNKLAITQSTYKFHPSLSLVCFLGHPFKTTAQTVDWIP